MFKFIRSSFFPILFCLFFLTLFISIGEECFAQAPTEQVALQKISKDLFKEGGWWGPGGYFSPIKLALYMIIFVIWVGSASWINADQERLKKENRETFNLVYVLLYGVGSTAVFFIPLFWVAFALTALICFVPSLTYVVIRNQSLPPGEQVLTGEHLFFLFAETMGKIGIKIPHQQRLAYQAGSPVEFEAVGKGVDPQILTGRLIVARNAPGYNLLRENIYEAVQSRATALLFDFSPTQTKIRHQVDGTWLDLMPIPRTLGRSKEKDIYEELLEAAKKLVGANPEDRRSKQGGSFKAVVGSSKKKNKQKKFDVDFMSHGTPTGEAAMIQLHAKAVPFKTLDEIGVRQELQPKFFELINSKKGILIVAAPPAHGLRSTMSVFSRVCDRFTRDVANVEDINGAGEPIENVVPGLYDSTKGETPMKTLPDLLFRGISLVFVRDMTNPEVLKTCCEDLSAEEHRHFITMLRAKEGVEALLRFLLIKVPSEMVVPHLNGVITQRLIRTLCPDCKEAYVPDPKVLQQLRLNPNQVKQLCRKRTPLPPHEEAKRGICHKCNGVGYFGRTALFELLTISDTVRALLLSGAEPAAIRQQFNKEGQQTFLHEGIRLLLKGDTTIEELSRVLKL